MKKLKENSTFGHLFPDNIWMSNVGGDIELIFPDYFYYYDAQQLLYFHSIIQEKIRETKEIISSADSYHEEECEKIKPSDDGSYSEGTAIFNRVTEVNIPVLKTQLTLLEKALEKCKDGTYGICEQTGGVMHPMYLKVKPWVLASGRSKSKSVA